MGIVITGYEIEELIQEGGFGEVYLAKRLSDKKMLAIKAMKPQIAKELRAQSQFHQEAKLLMSFNHPYIVKVYEILEKSPRPAITMEYFASQTLKSLILNNSPLLMKKGIGAFIKSLESLQYLHEQKILHKDIKPENILLAEDGDIRLIDFTLAEKMNFLGMFKSRKREGTPLYMSPEQVRKERLDEQSDIYSLGATFYEVFTGKLYINAPSEKAILQKVLKGSDIKVRQLNKNIPYQLETILARMLVRNKDKRYKTISEILFEMNKFADYDSEIKDSK